MIRFTGALLPVLLLAVSTSLAGQEPGPPAEPATGGLVYRISDLAGSVVYTGLADTEASLQDVLLDDRGAITHLVIRLAGRGASSKPTHGPVGPTQGPAGPTRAPASGSFLVPADRLSFSGSTFYLVVRGQLPSELADLPRLEEQVRAPQAGVGGADPRAGTADQGAGGADQSAGRADQGAGGRGRLVSAERLRGDAVIGERGQILGRVADVMLNFERKQIEYLAVDPGEMLQAVPAGEVRLIDPEREQVRLSIGAEQLSGRPGFSPEDWPRSFPRNR